LSLLFSWFMIVKQMNSIVRKGELYQTMLSLLGGLNFYRVFHLSK